VILKDGEGRSKMVGSMVTKQPRCAEQLTLPHPGAPAALRKHVKITQVMMLCFSDGSVDLH